MRYPFKGTIVDTPISWVGGLIATISIAIFLWVTAFEDPARATAADKELADWAFYGANIGMAMIFWSSMYMLGVRMLEGLTRKPSDKAPPKNDD